MSKERDGEKAIANRISEGGGAKMTECDWKRVASTGPASSKSELRVSSLKIANYYNDEERCSNYQNVFLLLFSYLLSFLYHLILQVI